MSNLSLCAYAHGSGGPTPSAQPALVRRVQRAVAVLRTDVRRNLARGAAELALERSLVLSGKWMGLIDLQVSTHVTFPVASTLSVAVLDYLDIEVV